MYWNIFKRTASWYVRKTGILALCLFALSTLGCEKKETITNQQEYTAAVARLVKDIDNKFYAEFNIHIQHRQINKTLWICVPTNKTLFIIKDSEDKGAKPPFDYKTSCTFLKDEKNFMAGYAFIESLGSNDSGIQYGATKEQERLINFLYQSILSEFVDTKGLDDYIEFVGFAFIDTENKIGLTYVFYIHDILKIFSGIIKGVEPSIRIKRDFFSVTARDVRANKYTARLKEILWGDFLATQIQTRVSYALKENSKFLKETSIENLEEIMTKAIVSGTKETLEYYPFRDFSKMYVKNLAMKKDPDAQPKIFYSYELFPENEPKKEATGSVPAADTSDPAK